jgi:hypothetical protein
MLAGSGPLRSGVTILDDPKGGSKDYTLSVSNGSLREEITLGTIDPDPQSILPGTSVTGDEWHGEWNGDEWHFYGHGGEDAGFDLKAEYVNQVFGLTLSPLNREGDGSTEWERAQYANQGDVIHFHAVLPETGVYRISLFFGQQGG